MKNIKHRIHRLNKPKETEGILTIMRNHGASYLSSVMLAMWRPSGQKLTLRTQRSFEPPANMGDGGGKRCLTKHQNEKRSITGS